MPLTDFFLDYFPGYNKFRAVSTILVIAGFTIPLMAALTLKKVFQDSIDKNKFTRSVFWSAGITGGICLLFALFPGVAGSFLSSNDYSLFQQLRLTPDVQKIFESAFIADRREMLSDDAFRSLVFIVLAAGLLMAYHYKKIPMKYTIGILTLFLLFDMWPVSKRFLNKDNFEDASKTTEPYPMSIADKAILEDKSPDYRVLNLTVSPFNDASTSNWHKSIGGYHGAKLQIYSELIENGLMHDITELAASYPNTAETLRRANSLNMLNTKYIIVDAQGLPLRNTNALGNAWFVDSYRLVENADEEISLINSFDPSGEALIDKSYSQYLSEESYTPDSLQKIELTSYKANELIYHYSSANEGLAVFSEIYYPAGWKSFIDGNETPHFKADYVLRAMEVPAGEHEITFRFDPDSYRTGTRISFASSFLLILLSAGSVYMMSGKKKTTNESDDSKA
jgi:hypothetical protein